MDVSTLPGNNDVTSIRSPSTSDTVCSDVLLPIQEICAIAKLSMHERRLAKQSRKRAATNLAIQRRKLRNSKLMENALEVLKPESQASISAREDAYASNYFHKVRSTVNTSQFNQFCDIMDQLLTPAANVYKAFNQISTLLSGYPELLDDFIPFLSAEQALECGVFMQHLLLTKMTDFILALETNFTKTPYLSKRVLAAIETLSVKKDVTLEEVTNTILPLLKGHPVLNDFFVQLLPPGRPPDSLHTDFDAIDEEAMSEGSDEEGPWERVELPPMADPYGGPACICSCHEDQCEKFRSRTQHCVPCSTKFMNGKVFIQSGKLLRRAQVSFTSRDMDYHRRRLFPCEPRKRKRSSTHASPTKSAYLSSDELKSDDDEKRAKRRAKAGRKCAKAAKSQDGTIEEKEGLLTVAIETTPEKSGEVSNSDAPNLAPVQLLIMGPDDLHAEGLSDFGSMPMFIEGANLKEESENSGIQEPIIMAINENIMPDIYKLEKEEVVLLTTSENVKHVDEDAMQGDGAGNACATTSNEKKNTLEIPWKIEEDKIILRTLQVEQYCEESFVKISHKLPCRTVEQIKGRFQHLLNILNKMIAESNE